MASSRSPSNTALNAASFLRAALPSSDARATPPAIQVTAPAPLGALKQLTVPAANTETLQVNGLQGGDTFDVTPAAGMPAISVDGGGQGGDALVVRAAGANQFVVDMSEAYYTQFHGPLQLNSAVRTMEQQYKLRFHNRNAAPEAGETASSHLAGITIDLAKRGLTKSQHEFVVSYLKNLRDQGLVVAIEERRTHCFHIMVSDRYTDWRETQQVAENIGQK